MKAIGIAGQSQNGRKTVIGLLRKKLPDHYVKIVNNVREAEILREKGGITILIWREGKFNNSEKEFLPFIVKCLNTQSWTDGQTSWLPFQGEVGKGMEIPFDIFIRNESSLVELEARIDNLLKLIKIKTKAI